MFSYWRSVFRLGVRDLAFPFHCKPKNVGLHRLAGIKDDQEQIAALIECTGNSGTVPLGAQCSARRVGKDDVVIRPAANELNDPLETRSSVQPLSVVGTSGPGT